MLIDSNIVIYAGKSEYEHIRQFIIRHAPVVSAISYVEVLGYHALTPIERQLYEAFFAEATILPLNTDVLHQAVLLRQQKKMTLGDALIASTALVFTHTLVTRNTKDFACIPSLILLNPFEDIQ